MAITSSSHEVRGYTQRATLGPPVAFAGSIFLVLAAYAASNWLVSPDLVIPVVVTLLFVLAGIAALSAWQTSAGTDVRRLTYWDVAGALTFIGIVLSALIDPDQMLRFVEGAERRP